MILPLAFALLGLAVLSLASDEWGADVTDCETRGDPGAWQSLAPLLTLLAGATAVSWMAAERFGWSHRRAVWVGAGLVLGALALFRPWWFWEGAKARWLRRHLGDDPTVGCYLALASAMIWAGLFADSVLGLP